MNFHLVRGSALLSISLIPLFCQLAFANTAKNSGIPFNYVGGHILVIPVKVGSKDSKFILDTGAGVNILSTTLAKTIEYKPGKQHSGRRMSGQKLTMKMARIPSLQVGENKQENVPVALWKFDDILPSDAEFKEIEGFVSLEYFKNTPFTLDYTKKLLYIENESSLKTRLEAGNVAPVEIEQHGNVETSIKIPITFSNKKKAKVEVDTGSGSLILDASYMKSFGISADDKSVKTTKGKDETGHAYVRYATSLPADFSLSAATQIKQSKPNVMFQKIIHQGLIGDSFLSNFIVTYDLPHKRMIFALPKTP